MSSSFYHIHAHSSMQIGCTTSFTLEHMEQIEMRLNGTNCMLVLSIIPKGEHREHSQIFVWDY